MKKLKSPAFFFLAALLVLCATGFSGSGNIESPPTPVQCDSLYAQIREVKLSVLRNYFTDTVGNNDLEKYGFIFVVSEPHAFQYSFLVNGKQFRFNNPPYHQIFVSNLLGTKVKRRNKDRHAYFIYDNLNHPDRNLPDTLKISFYQYRFTGKEGRKGNSYRWEQNKQLVSMHYFLPDTLQCKWEAINVQPGE